MPEDYEQMRADLSAKTMKQLRAEAVERLKEARYHRYLPVGVPA